MGVGGNEFFVGVHGVSLRRAVIEARQDVFTVSQARDGEAGRKNGMTIFCFPTTALPVQVQRDSLSCARISAAPLTRLSKLLEVMIISKTRWALSTAM